MSKWFYHVVNCFGEKVIPDMVSIPNDLKPGCEIVCSCSFYFPNKPENLPEEGWQMSGRKWKMTVDVEANFLYWQYDILIVGTNIKRIEETIKKVNSSFGVKKLSWAKGDAVEKSIAPMSETNSDAYDLPAVIPEGTDYTLFPSHKDEKKQTDIIPVVVENHPDDEYDSIPYNDTEEDESDSIPSYDTEEEKFDFILNGGCFDKSDEAE